MASGNIDGIYILVKRALPPELAKRTSFQDITIATDGVRYWGVGENPECFKEWAAAIVPGKPHEELLFGIGLKFMSHVIYERRNGTWSCVKNRFGATHPVPFTSIEEAKLISAVRGWPEPAVIG